MTAPSDHLTFFLDESQKTDVFQIKDGKPTFDNIDDLHSFVGIFCGYETSKIPDYSEKVGSFEITQKTRLKFSQETEIKSTTFRRKNFEHGFASIKRTALGFYKGLMELIIELEPIIAVSFTNKFEVLLRKTITDIDVGKKHADAFYYSLSKFFSLYGHDGFFQTLTDHPDDATFLLSQRLERRIRHDSGIPRLELRNAAYTDVVRILNQVDYTTHPIKHEKYPFIVLPDALILLLDELKISPKDVDVVIDGELGLYDCFRGQFHSTSYSDSKDNPMIRISDHIAGLISRMCYSLRNDPNRMEPKPGDSRREKNRLRTLSHKWFEIKDDTFELYHLAFDAIILNSQHHWSTVTAQYSDDFGYFVALLHYFHEIPSFDEFRGKTPAEHSLRFEEYACHYLKKIPECPYDPSDIISKYESK